jgi:hypothetical protein
MESIEEKMNEKELQNCSKEVIFLLIFLLIIYSKKCCFDYKTKKTLIKIN